MNNKKIEALYTKALKKSPDWGKYYTLEDLHNGIKRLIKDLKTQAIVCHIDISRSGMTRRFNFLNGHNMTLNILYNETMSHEPVRVGGAGMDMGFHLLYTFICIVYGYEFINKEVKIGRYTTTYNSLCSSYKTL